MSLLRKSLLEVGTPLLQIKRFRGKINIQKPKPPHFERAKYLAVSKPYFINPNKDKTMVELCTKGTYSEMNEKEVENPFLNILAQEALGFFQSSRLIAFYHANSINAFDEFRAYAMFKKEGMLLKTFGKKVIEKALKGTPYEAVLDIYISRNKIVFSPEPKIKQLLKITKKFPQLVLLAGVFEGRFVNTDDLIKYSSIVNLETAQAILVHTLNASATKLHRQLNCQQTSLLALLEDRKKQLGNQNE